jgi:hypothetical protein
MTQHTIDQFEAVRRGLLAATTRDRARRARRARVVFLCAMSVSSLVVVSGIAAAANERVATAISGAADSIFNVFDGPQPQQQPSAKAESRLRQMESGHGGDSSTPKGRELLRGHINGLDVEIVAVKRPTGSPTIYGASKNAELCYAIVTDLPDGDSTVCSGAPVPGMPANYSSGFLTTADGELARATIAGVTTDAVREVNIVTEHGTQSAVMGDHAFFWYGEHITPVRVEMVLDDGTVRSKAVDVPSLDCGDAPPPC